MGIIELSQEGIGKPGIRGESIQIFFLIDIVPVCVLEYEFYIKLPLPLFPFHGPIIRYIVVLTHSSRLMDLAYKELGSPPFFLILFFCFLFSVFYFLFVSSSLLLPLTNSTHTLSFLLADLLHFN